MEKQNQKINNQIVETAYEKRVRQNIRVLLISFAALVIIMIAGGIGMNSALGGDYAGGFVGITFVVYLLAFFIYFPIILHKMLKEKIEYADFYKNLNNEAGILTKIDALIVINGNKKKLKKPVLIDKTGFSNEELIIFWRDFCPEIQVTNIYGQNIYALKFVSNNGDLFFTITLNPKNFYLIKNYSPVNVDDIPDLEKSVRSAHRLDKRGTKQQEIPDNAKAFKSYFWIMVLIMSVVIIGISAAFAFLGIKLGWNSNYMMPVLIALIVPVTITVIYMVPRGTAYINKDTVYRRSFAGDLKIDLLQAEIIYGIFFIKFKTQLLHITIFKTKKAVSWIRECLNDNSGKKPEMPL